MLLLSFVPCFLLYLAVTFLDKNREAVGLFQAYTKDASFFHVTGRSTHNYTYYLFNYISGQHLLSCLQCHSFPSPERFNRHKSSAAFFHAYQHHNSHCFGVQLVSLGINMKLDFIFSSIPQHSRLQPYECSSVMLLFERASHTYWVQFLGNTKRHSTRDIQQECQSRVQMQCPSSFERYAYATAQADSVPSNRAHPNTTSEHGRGCMAEGARHIPDRHGV